MRYIKTYEKLSIKLDYYVVVETPGEIDMGRIIQIDDDDYLPYKVKIGPDDGDFHWYNSQSVIFSSSDFDECEKFFKMKKDINKYNL